MSAFPFTDKTIVYAPFFPEWELECPVTAITVCGEPVEHEDTLHYSLYFELEGQRSVILNMAPSSIFRDGPESRMGKINISSKDYAASPSSLFTMRFPTQREVNMEEILRIIKSQGRNRYQFDESGSGCRFWCQIVLGDLEEAGIIASGSVASFLASIQSKNAEKPAVFYLPVKMGKFY